VHRDAFALAALDRLQVKVFDRAVLSRFVFRRFFQTRGTADVECTHGQLRARFADRLRGNHADSLTDFDRPASCEVTSIALNAAATTRFAGQHRADSDPLHT